MRDRSHMHPIIHIIISILIGLGVMLHSKNKYLIVVLSALVVNGLIDSDVIFISVGVIQNRVFSTSITMVYLPLALLFTSYIYERKTDGSLMTRVSLVIILIGLGHLVLDTFSMEPVYLYYPFSMEQYSMNQGLLPYIGIIFFGLVIIVNLIETQIYKNKEGKKGGANIRGSLSPFLSNYKNRMKELKGDEEEGFFL